MSPIYILEGILYYYSVILFISKRLRISLANVILCSVQIHVRDTPYLRKYSANLFASRDKGPEEQIERVVHER